MRLTTTGIQANDPNDLILLDSSYRLRLAYRRRLLTNYPSMTYGALPSSFPAVSEFYTHIISHHLPTRFPQHFSKSPSGTLVQNHTTTDTYPIIAQSATNALRALGENLDEDFIFIVPSADGSWNVEAFIVCFPNGFSLSENLGWKLGEAHVPIPGFEGDLGKSLGQFFTKLAPGVENGVKMSNWTITRSNELFMPSGAHGGDDEACQEINPEDCCLRVERQTFWKLPGTGAVVFGTKTYLTPLSEIKSEQGEAKRLASAIESLGSNIGRYEGHGIWSEQVLAYLKH